MPPSPVASCLLAFMLAAGLPVASAPSPSVTSALARARQALDSADHAQTMASLDEALRLEPENPEALMLLGRVMVRMERFEEGVSAFRRCADVLGSSTPAGLDALCALADAETRRGSSRQAIEVLKTVLSAAPTRPSVNHDLGRIYLAVGELESAQRSFRAEIDLAGAPRPLTDPVIASSWEGLGLAAYRLGDDATALEALGKAPPTLDARFHAGLALARQGRHEEALGAFQEVLSKEPEHHGALQAVARSAAVLGRDAERRQALDRFATLYKKDEERRALRVRILELRTQAETLGMGGDTAGAVARLEEASRLSPDDMDIVVSLGRLHYAAKDLARAEPTFRKVIAAQPLNAFAHYWLGRVQADSGDVAGATSSLERACRASPMTLTYHVHLAQVYLRTKRAADGVHELRLARRLAPSDPESAYNLGLGLAQAGSLREAAAELEEAVRQGHPDPRVYQILSQIYARLGDAEASRRAMQTYQRLQAGETSPR